MSSQKPATPRVFISSTREDLPSYRAKAKDAVLRLGWFPDMCDYWAAGGNPPLDTCLAKIDQADVVVVIVAHRHGWTPTESPGDGAKSITRLECERARECRKTVIPFVAGHESTWPAEAYESHQLQVNAANPEKLAELAIAVPRNLIALNEFKSWLNTNGTRNVQGFANPDDLGLKIYQALSEWGRDEGKASQGPSNATIRQAYLAWLRGECESVELLGLDLKESQNVRLNHVYVPAVTMQAYAAARRGGVIDEYEKPDLFLHRLGKESLYVPGAPGAGKSTFCRWLALVVASGAVPPHPVGTPSEFEETLPETLCDRFPVLCRLRDWAGQEQCLKGNGRWTRKQLEGSLACWIEATRPGGLTPEVFRGELDAGHCLMILDGVDEIPEELGDSLPRSNFLSGLADAAKAWLEAGNRLLLTSRPYGLDDADRRKLGLPVAELGEVPESLQTTFVHRWYAVTDPPRAQEKAEGLIAHLDARPELRDLRANPMLLTALCVKYDEGQRLPQDVFRLYEAVTAQVLHKRYPASINQERARLRLAAVALGHSEPRTTDGERSRVGESRALCRQLGSPPIRAGTCLPAGFPCSA